MTNWEERYQEGNTGWDIGYPSTPIKEYFDQLTDKSIRILIPGAGNAYEAEYLHELGFTNVFVLDIAPSPLKAFAERNPSFPKAHLIEENFFIHESEYDLIMEQTFFCAITPDLRTAYAEKVNKLLASKGKLTGLLWSVKLNEDHPPYGGSKEEYQTYFDVYFHYIHFEKAHNSIQPRKGRELFLLAQKKC
jgi:hypothetical protein